MPGPVTDSYNTVTSPWMIALGGAPPAARPKTDIARFRKKAPVDVADILKRTEPDIVACYLPVGSQMATEYCAEQSLEAGYGFVNCIPVFIALDEKWRKRFLDAQIPLAGEENN